MEATQAAPTSEKTSWLDRPVLGSLTLNWATVLFIGIMLVTVVSRFYILGARVMSHDEVSHVYFSWQLEQGRGYKHDPVTHGPLQFHLMALSYFLFGDNDFTARLPHAMASIATIAFMWFYRRYLGRVGWIVAAVLLLISPYILYYGRYARNEALVGLFFVIMLWAMLRYLETGAPRYLYWFIAAIALHFTSKETAYIYAAQALIFLALYFIFRVYQTSWPNPSYRRAFVITLLIGLLLILAGGATFLLGRQAGTLSATETIAPSVPGETPVTPAAPSSLPALLLSGTGAIVLLVAIYFMLRGLTLSRVRAERSFDLLIMLGTMVLPMAAPFPVKLLGWNPLDYSSQGMLRTGLFLVPLAALAVGIGLWWNPRLWLGNAALFYGIYIVFYTTLFTNGTGFFTGIIGSLGYWLEQQGVQRGGQPWYYYAFVQIPIYEYLPAMGSLLALGLALFGKPFSKERQTEPDQDSIEGDPQRMAVTLLGFWSITSLLAYTYAGEKMPWLTVHIALPMILLSGWSFGYLIESIDWQLIRARRGALVLILLVVFLLSLAGVLGSLLGTNPPLQGKTLEQLQATSTFLLALLTTLASGAGLFYLARTWPFAQLFRLLGLTFFGLLAFLTARTAYTASFVNYDYANEYLVYAHSAPGPKLILKQVEEISRRTTDGLAIAVAYDDKTTYPYWWYFRNYPNARFYGANPTRDLRELPIIIVGSPNYGKIEPIVGQAFHQFDYIRLWWPNQDYFNLTWARVWNALRDPSMRSALFRIWLNRDHTAYSQLVGRDMSFPNWQPSEAMRMYVRKDIAAKIWNYGVGPSPEEVVADPYEGKESKLTADVLIGLPGAGPGQFNRPRDLAVAPDGTLYVADTDNHRIQHLTRDGEVLHTWGSFADISKGPAPAGTFYEPWGIAVGPDGSVFVADTWNHRVQKFSPSGEFLKMWGYFGQAEAPEAFWGPRDVIVDASGRLLVTDTGNKRIAIFDTNGNFLNQFGSEGFDPGQFNEPVGMALDDQGRLYVADTWNQRIQVFEPDGAVGYSPVNAWDVSAWYGQSLDNKPYLSFGSPGHLFATDPEGYRVLEFTPEGEIVRFWGDYGTGPDGFGLAGSVAADLAGGVWVSDPGNNRIMHFNLPEE